jgi:hypothetical protein
VLYIEKSALLSMERRGYPPMPYGGKIQRSVRENGKIKEERKEKRKIKGENRRK